MEGQEGKSHIEGQECKSHMGGQDSKFVASKPYQGVMKEYIKAIGRQQKLGRAIEKNGQKT